MYLYRTDHPARRRLRGTRYFSTFDRFMVLVGAAATLAGIGMTIATHGAALVSVLNQAVGIGH